MYRVILFDLDGTLTDSGEGITKSVQYAIEKMGLPAPELSELVPFVGPPLLEQFMSFCNFSEEQARKAIEYYRERYSIAGIYENKPYDGIVDALGKLKDQGYLLAVASSKPEYYVEKIVDYFSMSQYFDAVVGSEMSGSRTKKSEVVEEALRRLKFENRKSEVILVGDREYDVFGARDMGLDCLAVSYGYGSREELSAAAPAAMVSSVAEMLDFFA